MNGDYSRVALVPCYVLHQRAYRESSLLLDVFSRDLGRVSLVARGVKRRKNRLNGLLRAFVPLQLSWSGRGELQTLTDAEQAGGMVMLTDRALYCGLYLNELLLHMLYPRDPHPEIFRLYEQTLQGLLPGIAMDVQLRYFELAMLDYLGYAPALTEDSVTGDAVNPQCFYRYLFDQGLVKADFPEEGCYAGSSLIALVKRSLRDEPERRDAKRLMRQLLDFHLDGRPLNSRKLFAHATASRKK